MSESSTAAPVAAAPPANGALAKTAAYCAMFIGLGLGAAAIGPTLPSLAANTGSTVGQISFLITARALGYMLGSFRSGKLYDRMSGHAIIVVSLLVLAAMLALVPFVPLLWLLIGAILIIGATEGAVDVGGNVLLVWLHGRHVGPYMNALHFFWGLGAFLSPVIIAQVALLSGNPLAAYWVLALLILPMALWVLRLPSPARHGAQASAPAGQADSRLLLLLVAFFFLYIGVESTFANWIYTYALTLGLADAINAAYLTSAYWGAFTAGRLVTIPLAHKLDPRRMLAVDLAGCLASIAIVLIWPDSAAALWAGAIGMGLATASVFPVSISLAERFMTMTGQVTAWLLVGASAGGILFPLFIGQLFERVGPQIMMLTVLGDLVLAVGVFVALMRLKQGGRQAAHTG